MRITQKILRQNTPEHYCFFRRVQRSDYDDSEDYDYEKTKQELRARDLERYGIRTLFVDNYSEITDILRDIEVAVKRNNVFISGSAEDYADWGRDKAEELAAKISESLVKNDFKVISGFGLGIGSSVVNGALTEIYQSKCKHTDKYLCLRPFPQGIKDTSERKEVFRRYRKDMISDTGVAIFFFFISHLARIFMNSKMDNRKYSHIASSISMVLACTYLLPAVFIARCIIVR